MVHTGIPFGSIHVQPAVPMTIFNHNNEETYLVVALLALDHVLRVHLALGQIDIA